MKIAHVRALTAALAACACSAALARPALAQAPSSEAPAPTATGVPMGSVVGAGGAPLDTTPVTVPPAAANGAPAGAADLVPGDYTIGQDDVLTIVFWRNQEMSGDVTVRPDGRISLPLINDVQASGLTPDALRQKLVAAATTFMAAPTVTVVVKQINSRKVAITGMIAKPGQYTLGENMTVIQLIAMAGGLQEFAHGDRISVIRHEKDKQVRYRVNYDQIAKGEKLQQNIELQVGDTVIVP